MTNFEHPDYREIDTPWEPQPIAWRFNGTKRATDELHTQVADPNNTHVVREVEVAISPVAGLLTVEQTRADISLAQDHFDLLASYPGLAIADTDWHVFADLQGKTRTLARVEIIDGDKLEFMNPAERGIITDEACEALEAEGKKVNHLHLRLLSPFPTEALRPYIEGAKKVLIVEEDLTEQLRELFAIHFSCHDKLLSCLQYDGTPFTASTILKKAKEVF